MSTFTKRIDSNIRDLYDWNDGSWHVSYDLERIGNLGGVVSGISLRFIEVNVPQGATIESAKITFRATNTKSNTDIDLIIHGVDEDNTAEFTVSPISDARTRTHTSNNVGWSGAISWISGSDYDTPDITGIIQEIIDREGWSSGNAIGISIQDNGSGTNQYLNPRDYNWDSAHAPLLTIEYSGTVTQTQTVTSKAAVKTNISQVVKAKANIDSDIVPLELGVFVSKPTYDADDDDPSHLIFSSDYGTLKYFNKGTFEIYIDGDLVGNLDSVGSASITHNLGYVPYFEVYMLDPLGNYSYCPTFGGGASTTWKVFVSATTTTLRVTVQISGFETQPTFYFIYFLFRNNLDLI